jgi:hypothetical protein
LFSWRSEECRWRPKVVPLTSNVITKVSNPKGFI